MHPRRHRFVLINWIAVYPVITLVLWLLGPVLSAVPLPIETLIVSALLVTVMNYAVMPNVTRLFRFWLHPRHSMHGDDDADSRTQTAPASESAPAPAGGSHVPSPEIAPDRLMARPKALITGASSGIGECISRQLADRGYDLVLVARREERLTALRDELSGRVEVEILVADLSLRSDIEAACARLRRGDVDVLVSNAGASGYELFTQTDEQSLQRNWLLNTTASLMLARAAVLSMVEHDRGGIILVASGLAFSGGDGRPESRRPHRTLYASAKAALEVFGRTLAEELHTTNVAVTVLCPPRTSSEWNGGAYSEIDVMTPNDVASAALSAFDAREVICLSGLRDTAVWDNFVAAERAVIDGNGQAQLAPRYHSTSIEPDSEIL